MPTAPTQRVFQALQRAQASLVKQAGILDAIVTAPFSAVAAALSAPTGSRGRAGALGAVVGAGLAALAQEEYEKIRDGGGDVSPVDFLPLFRAVLGGLATGGVMRASQEQRDTGRLSLATAFLAGAPAGALAWGGHPVMGALMGTAAAPILSRIIAPAAAAQAMALGAPPIPEAAIRARAALLVAKARQEEALRGLRALNAYAIANPVLR